MEPEVRRTGEMVRSHGYYFSGVQMKDRGLIRYSFPFERQWQEHRDSRVVWLLFLGWLPFGALVMFPPMWFTGSEKVGFGLAATWMLAYVVFGTRAGNLR
jgi:hypothetical protein